MADVIPRDKLERKAMRLGSWRGRSTAARAAHGRSVETALSAAQWCGVGFADYLGKASSIGRIRVSDTMTPCGRKTHSQRRDA
jgi:hypothetical protein